MSPKINIAPETNSVREPTFKIIWHCSYTPAICRREGSKGGMWGGGGGWGG